MAGALVDGLAAGFGIAAALFGGLYVTDKVKRASANRLPPAMKRQKRLSAAEDAERVNASKEKASTFYSDDRMSTIRASFSHSDMGRFPVSVRIHPTDLYLDDNIDLVTTCGVLLDRFTESCKTVPGWTSGAAPRMQTQGGDCHLVYGVK